MDDEISLSKRFQPLLSPNFIPILYRPFYNFASSTCSISTTATRFRCFIFLKHSVKKLVSILLVNMPSSYWRGEVLCTILTL